MGPKPSACPRFNQRGKFQRDQCEASLVHAHPVQCLDVCGVAANFPIAHRPRVGCSPSQPVIAPAAHMAGKLGPSCICRCLMRLSVMTASH